MEECHVVVFWSGDNGSCNILKPWDPERSPVLWGSHVPGVQLVSAVADFYCIVNGRGCHDLESTWLGLQGRCKDFREIREGRRGWSGISEQSRFHVIQRPCSSWSQVLHACHWEATDVSPSTVKCGTLRKSITVVSIALLLDPEA